MERTLILLKPDAVQRGLVGRIIARFEDKGLKLVGMKLMKVDRGLAEQLYAPHKGKPFYPGLVGFMTSAPVVAMALQGIDAIRICRAMMGATFGADAAPGTLRGDFGASRSFNLVHGSDGPESAARELALLFPEGPGGTLDYDLDSLRWTYDPIEELKQG